MRPKREQARRNFQKSKLTKPKPNIEIIKQTTKYNSGNIDDKLATLRSTLRKKKQTQIESKVIEPILSFLQSIAMESYYLKIIESGIDSMELLKEIKQKQLEQLGIVKGHSLKIIWGLKKLDEDKLNIRQNTGSTYNSQKLNKQGECMKNNVDVKVFKDIGSEITIQTQNFVQNSKYLYCLYCFNRSKQQYCDEKCETLYNSMFQQYENNLKKTQQQFKGQEIRNSEQNQQQLSQQLQFYNIALSKSNNQQNLMDSAQYKTILKHIRKIKFEQ